MTWSSGSLRRCLIDGGIVFHSFKIFAFKKQILNKALKTLDKNKIRLLLKPLLFITLSKFLNLAS